MADSYTAIQSWAVFAVALAGIGYYYVSTGKKTASKPTSKSVPAREAKTEVKKAAKKGQGYVEKAAAATSAIVGDSQEQKAQSSQNGIKKRKANTQAPIQTTSAPSASQVDDDEIDMSTRRFAESLRKAQKGTDLKKTDKTEARVKTVKAKNSQVTAPAVPGSVSSSQAGDDDWSPVGSPVLPTSGVEDMLEPAAPGPNSLRITAPTKPIKEKVNKPKKEVQEESKKARQNRQKKEAAQAARAEADAEQKRLMELQRRTAREARGEPARNGAAIPAAPAKNPWAEQNAMRDAEVVASSNQAPLLDTFDVESNSSSNAEVSTAATSTTDSAPANIVFPIGWSQVKTKKAKNKANLNGDSTPVQKPVATTNTKSQPQKKASGFGALPDEYVDTPSNWDA